MSDLRNRFSAFRMSRTIGRRNQSSRSFPLAAQRHQVLQRAFGDVPSIQPKGLACVVDRFPVNLRACRIAAAAAKEIEQSTMKKGENHFDTCHFGGAFQARPDAARAGKAGFWTVGAD